MTGLFDLDTFGSLLFVFIVTVLSLVYVVALLSGMAPLWENERVVDGSDYEEAVCKYG